MTDHSSSRYHPSTLEKRKGKWYVAVTKPKELQFGKDKQKRKSTGTSDKRQAEYRQHELTRVIYDEFDKDLKRTDPFFEAVRPILESEGIHRTRDWYDKGVLVVTLRGDKAFMTKLRGATADVIEQYEITDHLGLCFILTVLGHPIPASALPLLDSVTREKVVGTTKPLGTPPDVVMNLYKQSDGDQDFVTGFLENWNEHATTKIATSEVGKQEATDPRLADIIDTYLASRPEKSRKADRLQLKKWLEHPLHSIPLKDVLQYDAYDFLTELGETLTKSSVRVVRAAMSNVFVWAGKQRDLGITGNPFRGLDLKDLGKDGVPRRPLTHDELHSLFKLDMTQGERDALIVLVTTGMRSGELMQITDTKEKDGIKYLDLTTRNTKTLGSKRFVPLHDQVRGAEFPLNFSPNKLNALVRKVTTDPTVSLHSLRHTFKDLARDAGVSKEHQDFITGHSQGDVASSYGQGPSIKTRYECIMAVRHPWFSGL
ncbi:MAG: DUF6538 domain-containing protein [Yoonia sp.]